LGLAAEGLHLLFTEGTAAGRPDAAAAAELALRHPEAIAAQLRPHPPIADGKAASLAGATAMLDVSDGLAIDARRIAAASGVALDLHAVTGLALTGGEDHALLATFPDDVALPGGFRQIGVVLERADGGNANEPASELLVDGHPYRGRGGWDPYAIGDGASAWDGAAN
jgi:thiamine-monophosphate kinase